MTETEIQTYSNQLEEIDKIELDELCECQRGYLEFVFWRDDNGRYCNQRCPACGNKTEIEPYPNEDEE